MQIPIMLCEYNIISSQHFADVFANLRMVAFLRFLFYAKWRNVVHRTCFINWNPPANICYGREFEYISRSQTENGIQTFYDVCLFPHQREFTISWVFRAQNTLPRSMNQNGLPVRCLYYDEKLSNDTTKWNNVSAVNLVFLNCIP